MLFFPICSVFLLSASCLPALAATLAPRQDVEQEEVKGPPPDEAAFAAGIPIGRSSNPNETDSVADSNIFDSLQSRPSWKRDARAAAQYLDGGSVYSVIGNEKKYRMAVLKVCGKYFYSPNLYWKGGFTGAHIHQDNKRNKDQFYPGINQATANLIGGSTVARDQPIDIMTSRTSSWCGALPPSWTNNGNWGKLGDIIDHFIRLWQAPKHSCAMSASSGAGGHGVQCALPCDPISPLWLESTDKYVRQTRSAGGKKLYSAVYKLRGRFNRGDGNGGLGDAKWLNAQCDGDDLQYKKTPNDPTYVVFW